MSAVDRRVGDFLGSRIYSDAQTSTRMVITRGMGLWALETRELQMEAIHLERPLPRLEPERNPHRSGLPTLDAASAAAALTRPLLHKEAMILEEHVVDSPLWIEPINRLEKGRSICAEPDELKADEVQLPGVISRFRSAESAS